MERLKYGWCATCGGVQPVRGSVLVPIRETVPHYQYRFVWFAACPERHALATLCEGCGKAPTRDGYDYCLTCWPEGADEPVQERGVAA